jgi:NAD(P)-dependent dehydrogenase (short-subunit alcohol dehydrogenase family)
MGERLRAKTVIVTGGYGLIGTAICTDCAQEGANVVVVGRDQQKATSLAERIEEAGGHALGVGADVSLAADMTRTAAATLERFGSLDGLVCGAVWQEMGNALELSEEGWDRTLAIGLKGVWLAVRACLPSMLAQGAGSIVTISSIQGQVSYPRRVAYGAVKGGVASLTRQLAVEWAPRGIRVNAISPGAIVSAEMMERMDATAPGQSRLYEEAYPVGHVGAPEDVAWATAYLLSDEARFVTGVDLPVDGGLLAQSPEAILLPRLRVGWRPGRWELHLD